MKNKCHLIISVVLILAIVFICVIFINNNNKSYASEDDNDFEYENEDAFDIVYCSFEEFVDKIEIGDTRALNQNNYQDWQSKAKELYANWYDKGYIPAISDLEEYKVNTFKVTNDMLGISYCDDYINPKNYYDIIILSDDIQEKSIDIEEYYSNNLKYQDEILKSLNGEYKLISVNNMETKAAVIDHGDGTLSVDFIWQNRYWIRMWDIYEIIEHRLNNFNIDNYYIQKPAKFDDVNFKQEISYPEIEAKRINVSASETDIALYNGSLYSNQKELLFEVFKNKVPTVEIKGKYAFEYQLEQTDLYDEDKIDYIRYHYKNNEEKETITVSISPDIYLRENIEEYIDIYLDMFNSTNPYKYDQETAEKYGVYTVRSDENKNNYSVEYVKDTLYINYSKTGYNYSELIVLRDGRFVKLSCEKENHIPNLKEFYNNIIIYEK